MNLTNPTHSGYACRILAIAGCEFKSSEVRSGRKPASLSAAFFVSVRSISLWWVGRGGASLLVTSGTSLLTSLGLPPVIKSPDGRFTMPEGASL